MSEDHDHDPYCADPPRDSRDMPPFLEAMQQLASPTVKVPKCPECGGPMEKCHNCAVNKPTGIKE